MIKNTVTSIRLLAISSLALLAIVAPGNAATLKWSYPVAIPANYTMEYFDFLPSATGSSAWIVFFNANSGGTSLAKVIWLSPAGAVIHTGDIFINNESPDVRFVRFTTTEIAVDTMRATADTSTRVIRRFKKIGGRIIQSDIPIGPNERAKFLGQSGTDKLGFLTFDEETATIRRYSN